MLPLNVIGGAGGSGDPDVGDGPGSGGSPGTAAEAPPTTPSDSKAASANGNRARRIMASSWGRDVDRAISADVSAPGMTTLNNSGGVVREGRAEAVRATAGAEVRGPALRPCLVHP